MKLKWRVKAVALQCLTDRCPKKRLALRAAIHLPLMGPGSPVSGSSHPTLTPVSPVLQMPDATATLHTCSMVSWSILYDHQFKRGIMSKKKVTQSTVFTPSCRMNVTYVLVHAGSSSTVDGDGHCPGASSSTKTSARTE
jgi:hypothetical protein